MKKMLIAGAAAMVLCSAPAFAQSGNLAIPGVGNVSGSAGSTITRSTITVRGNEARDITAGGGEASFKIGAVEMDGVANVNSVNITGSEVTDSHILVEDNVAEGVRAIGGTANVNSVNIN